MGLGKTVITLSAFYTLKFRGEIKNCLVIAPKKVAENVWRQEAEKWEHLQNLTFSIVLGSAKKRIEALLQAQRDLDHWQNAETNLKES